MKIKIAKILLCALAGLAAAIVFAAIINIIYVLVLVGPVGWLILGSLVATAAALWAMSILVDIETKDKAQEAYNRILKLRRSGEV